MKTVGILQGIAACRESPEEYAPPIQPPLQDTINLIRNTYQFMSFPIIPPGTQAIGTLSYLAGRFSKDDYVFSINQLVMATDGDIVAAGSTDQADQVLDHLMRLLDDTFGYRLQTSNKIKSYVSNVVVEFDRGFEDYIGKLNQMEAVINLLRGTPERRFKIKRIGFGSEEFSQATDPLLSVETADFVIERRVRHRFEENRYFCSAPMQTADHIRVLEQIEAIARG